MMSKGGWSRLACPWTSWRTSRRKAPAGHAGRVGQQAAFRDDAPSEVRARQEWRWLYLHTCGAARKQLEEAEKKEQPFNRKLTKTVKVEIDSVTKTVTPESYQVLWRATTVDKYNPRPEEVLWTSTFTVGRVSPKTLSDATLNNLGLCVTWSDDDKRQ